MSSSTMDTLRTPAHDEDHQTDSCQSSPSHSIPTTVGTSSTPGPGSDTFQIDSLGLSLGSRSEVETQTAWDAPPTNSEISRTPSQSTTGTCKTHNSLDTAASSLQSAGSAPDVKRTDVSRLDKQLPDTPENFSTALPSPEEQIAEKRNLYALRRYFALLELVQSECMYVQDLNILVNIYFDNLVCQPYFEENEYHVAAVCRNGRAILEWHTKLAEDFQRIIDDCHINQEASGFDLEKALRSDEAVLRVAQHLTKSVSGFDAYHQYCSMHAEADQILMEARAQHSGHDFSAYERMCSNLVRTSSGTTTPRHTPSRRSSTVLPSVLPLTHGTSDTIPSSPSSPVSPTSQVHSTTASGSTTPSGSFSTVGQTSRQSQNARLRFNDYHIKPVQRLCRYALFLNAILQYSPPEDLLTTSALRRAIEVLDTVSTAVDQASLRRQKEVVGDLVSSRLDTTSEINDEFLSTLGPPDLVGVLNVFHHHVHWPPMAPPLRFQRLGIVLWPGFIILVRAKKNRRLECHHFFPIADATLQLDNHDDPVTEVNAQARADIREAITGKNLFRLSVHGHVYDFSARTEKERSIWYNAMRIAIDKSHESLIKYPHSLYPFDGDSTSQTGMGQSLQDFLFASISNPNIGNRDTLVKFPTSSSGANFDRLMTFSDVFKETTGVANLVAGNTGSTGSLNKDIYEIVVAQQLRPASTPSISSSMSAAALGIARKATTQMRSRKNSGISPIDTTLTRKNTMADVALMRKSAIAEVKDKSSTSDAPTPRRNSLSTVRANSMSSESSGTTSPHHVASPPLESFGSRFKGTLRRQTSRPDQVSSLDSIPSEARLASQTAFDQSNIEAVAAGASVQEPASVPLDRFLHARRKSLSLKEAFQASVGRRSRSQSVQSVLDPLPTGLPAIMQEPHSLSTADYTQTQSPDGGHPTSSYLPLTTMDFSSHKSSPPSSKNTSAVNSRRGSIASILKSAESLGAQSSHLGNPQSRNSYSPGSSIAQLREGAVSTLRRARSTAWNRWSFHGNVPMSVAAEPLATSAEAHGLNSRADTISTDQPYSYEDNGQQDKILSQSSKNAVNPMSKVRGSLVRNLSFRKKKSLNALQDQVSRHAERDPTDHALPSTERPLSVTESLLHSVCESASESPNERSERTSRFAAVSP